MLLMVGPVLVTVQYLFHTATTSTYTRMFPSFFPRRRRGGRGGGWRDRRGDGGQAKGVAAVRHQQQTGHLPAGPETLSRQHPSAQLRRPAALSNSRTACWEADEVREQLPGAEAERRAAVLESSVRRRGQQRQTQDSQRAGEAAQERAEDELPGSEGRSPAGGQQWESSQSGDPEKGDRVHRGDPRGREEAADDEGRAEEEEPRAETQTGAAEDFTLTLYFISSFLVYFIFVVSRYHVGNWVLNNQLTIIIIIRNND